MSARYWFASLLIALIAIFPFRRTTMSPIVRAAAQDPETTTLDDQTSQAEEEPANRGCPQGLSIPDATLGAIERPEDQA